MQTLNISWLDFDNAVQQIADFYQDKKITKVIGIIRGGLPLAVALSHKLSVPMDTLVWKNRDDRSYDITKIKYIRDQIDVETTLFVDDICDSGQTIDQIQSWIPQSRWCTLVTKCIDRIEFSPMPTTSERWVTFPWEQNNKYLNHLKELGLYKISFYSKSNDEWITRLFVESQRIVETAIDLNLEIYCDSVFMKINNRTTEFKTGETQFINKFNELKLQVGTHPFNYGTINDSEINGIDVEGLTVKEAMLKIINKTTNNDSCKEC